MMPHPTANGLTLCDNVVIERGTDKVAMVGSFVLIGLQEFPGPAPFYAVAVLVGGWGNGRMELALTHLDTDEDLFGESSPIQFTDRLASKTCIFRLEGFDFPTPGTYQVTLSVDGEWVAQKRFRVHQR